jgi:transcriptional regulator with XRE-family HTH domain
MATRAIRDLDGFASNLRGERSRRGFTQEQLAHETGITTSEISRLERCLREPRILTVVRLADALRIAPAELLDGMGKYREGGAPRVRA